MFNPDQLKELEAPLQSEHVSDRKQGGTTLSYIEGWWVIHEANRIFGFGEWERETVYCREVSRVETTIGQAKAPGWKVGYEALVRVVVRDAQGDRVSRTGVGLGSGISKDLFEAIEGAAKEAETDAMKRALMTFGNPFGLALYDKKKRFVESSTDSAYKLKKDDVWPVAVDRIERHTDSSELDKFMRTDLKKMTERWPDGWKKSLYHEVYLPHLQTIQAKEQLGEQEDEPINTLAAG